MQASHRIVLGAILAWALVMIVPETDQQVDPITYAPSLGKEIENEYGREALEGLRTIGFKFEEPVG